MKVPLSWLKDYVDISLPLDSLAKVLTMLGLEVDEVRLVGLPLPEGYETGTREFKFTGLSWDPAKIVVAQIDEVLPHPNADRLVLCRLKDGQVEHIVLTGAPNLYPFKGQGPLPKPIKVAYAKEGARLYDGHQPGQVITTLKRAKIRGVESYSMVCSEKELGISDEHEGVIFLDDDAPTGMSLVDYMGDAVYEISILPNMIRNASVVGVAREIAAATGQPLRKPEANYKTSNETIEGKVNIQITDPQLNSRFLVGLIKGVQPQPSPYLIQRRLRLAGMRPINHIVDATNYVMLETGQPLHAFDYDVLVQRAGGSTPTIITRPAEKGERLTTLDGVERELDPFTIMVCDTAGSLSLAGVMGGAESEVTDSTRNILLEGATWNFINVRRTITAQKLASEAAYRFARGVHPALSQWGVQLGLQRMAEWGGGEILSGLVDNHPYPLVDPVVELTASDVKRLLGIDLSVSEIAALLSRLEFACSVDGERISAKVPPHRLDIGEGVIGKADLCEEIARLYGYDNIPETRLSATLPRQRGNPDLENEERIVDILVGLGLQQVISYRMTSVEREARLLPKTAQPAVVPYITLQNPITPERSVMRRSVLSSVMEAAEHNFRLSDRLAFFEVGSAYIPVDGSVLPNEPKRLAIVMAGKKQLSSWDVKENPQVDFFDLKGIIQALSGQLHLPDLTYQVANHPSFHPGKSATLVSEGVEIGVFGELHPRVIENFDLGNSPVLAADLNLEAILKKISVLYTINPVPVFPPVLEDIAVVVDESLPEALVEEAIWQAGGKVLTGVRLFDIFRSSQIGAGKKSLAYSLVYQAGDRTLNDGEATQIRQRIIKRLDEAVGAKLRS